MSIVKTSAAWCRNGEIGSRKFACAAPKTFPPRPRSRARRCRLQVTRLSPQSSAFGSASRAALPSAACRSRRRTALIRRGSDRGSGRSGGIGSPPVVLPTVQRALRERSTRHDRGRRQRAMRSHGASVGRAAETADADCARRGRSSAESAHRSRRIPRGTRSRGGRRSCRSRRTTVEALSLIHISEPCLLYTSPSPRDRS